MPQAVESRTTFKNRILSSLPKAEISRLAPNLSPVDLPSGKTLLDPGQDIPYGFFLETGLASVVVTMRDGSMVETGITGNEGLVGIPLLLGTKTMPTRTFMQIPGHGFKIKAQRLSEEYERSATLRKLVNRFFQAHLVQTGQTAACNRLHDIAERLARWLLMCHDRMDADHFTITHEFLGHMLGTPRSTVTLAAGILSKSELIQYSRGKVTIRDRKGLEKAACECYQTIRNEFNRLGMSPV